MFTPAFSMRGPEMDEGTPLIYAELVSHGKIPYRDFETFYGPANPYVLAGVYALFGTNIVAERSVGLAYRLLALAAIFAIASRFGNASGVCATMLAGIVLVSTGVCAYAWFGAAAAALWSLALITSRSRTEKKVVAAGILAGVALLYRVDVAPAIILGVLPALVALTWKGRAHFCVGGAIPLSLLAILAPFAGITQMWNNFFLYPVLRSNPGRHMPFAAAHVFHAAFFLSLGTLFVALAAGVYLWRSRPAESIPVLCLALFSLATAHQAVQRLDDIHLSSVIFISLALAPVAFSLALSIWLPRPYAPIGLALAFLAVGLAAPFYYVTGIDYAVAAAQFRGGLSPVVRHGSRWFPVAQPGRAAALTKVLDALDSQAAPGDRLFVGPADLRRTNYNDAFIYHLMMPRLVPATYFIELNPLSANRPGGRLASDIGGAQWLILNRAWDNWREPNASSAFGSNEANEVVRERFTKVVSADPYTLLRRTEARTP